MDGGHAGNAGAIPVRHENAPLKALYEYSKLLNRIA